MYRLDCPHCQSPTPVGPASAGDTVPCDSCGQSIAVPRLGDLKRLPPVDPAESPTDQKSAARSDTSAKPRSASPTRTGGDSNPILLAIAGLLIVGGLLTAGFCGFQYYLSEVPMTTQRHLAEYDQVYREVPPANLILEYESMEEQNIDLAGPLVYVKMGQTKRRWATNAIAGLAVASVGLGGVLIASGRRS